MAFGIVNRNLELYVNADDTIRKLLSVPLSESEVHANNEMQIKANTVTEAGEEQQYR